ncbi:hypothetical protein SAMN05421676_105134 [Salinibacillus kushneri]|uniref:Uncharacterized protein n=1 Tax=Salinibacillus kushneri TaxID=237682 RepID=A0A1I0F074_9BACI|nr:hypothetical protein [Salinibacillus kushneri]SET50781.1 hypothetical protein SAMN05421676_105134 [Salinibacillus kushneri]
MGNKKLFIIGGPVLILFLMSGFYSLFYINQVAILPVSECRDVFTFTPEDVQYCSDIYVIDSILLALTKPSTYIYIGSGMILAGILVKIIRR